MIGFGLSDKGTYRAENQDSFDVAQLQDGLLAVVCDGMGGAAAGFLASDMACARFVGQARSRLEKNPDDDCRTLKDAAEAANRKVFHFASDREEYSGMGTTLVAGFFRRDSATIVNIGDSRAYRISREGVVQISKDHSVVQSMVDRGELTAAQARKHPRRNLITRAVGTDAFVDCDIFEISIKPGDRFLLCSDGLTNAVEDAEIHRLIMAADGSEAACRALVEAALQNDARDNVTAVVISPDEGGDDRG